jgi:uncharacterized protein (UPF0548 family)
MLLLHRPDAQAIAAFLISQKASNFSYPEVGATRGSPPPGYLVDHNRICLGTGRDTFARARAAITAWKMFDVPGLFFCDPSTPVREGETVALLVQHFAFWSLNACRIVYVFEEGGAIEKFGFAYGTLPEHGAIGEERFRVEFHSGDNSVSYDLLAFSRPTLLAKLAYPYARTLQRRFARESKAAMLKASNE